MDLQAAKAYILARLKNELGSRDSYHSLEHTLDVYASTIEIAEKEGIKGDDLLLLKTAALFHDAGFIIDNIDHEVLSVQIAREQLPGFGYTVEQIDQVCIMIMATKLPHRPDDPLSMILCDADLDYLGRNDFKRIGDLLYNELRLNGTINTYQEWIQLQVRFLDEHRYFTATNKALREPLKQKHLAKLRKGLARKS